MTHHDHPSHGEHAPAHDEHPPSHGKGHDKHAGHSVAMFRDRFWLSLLLSLPVVFFSETIQGWFGYTAPSFPGSELVSPVLGTIIFLYGGSPFLRGGWQEAVDRQPGMMLLIGMAITVAFIASATTTLGWFDLEFWWELAALITVMLLGHWMEMRAIGQARGALAAL
ncbi:MAG TPA: heavy metal translocating P-type ATPase, partial [Acidimicrobiia bacterium]|nr:heavy metal translocating P-type ATPase [Acidimicrobiia bacterium]